jgi:pSer/pThr/pTyr-binding forkhead associated (FHA) protein
MRLPRLVVKAPDGGSFVREVDKDVFAIGRANGNDIVLDDSCQARRHVEIHREDDLFYLHDLGCRCAKYVNGVVVRDITEIRAGDVLTLGGYQLMFLLDDES